MSEGDSMQLRNIEKKDIQEVFDLGSTFFAGPDKLDWAGALSTCNFWNNTIRKPFS